MNQRVVTAEKKIRNNIGVTPRFLHLAPSFLSENEYKKNESKLRNQAFRTTKFSSHFKRHSRKSNVTEVAIPSLSKKKYEVWTTWSSPGVRGKEDGNFNLYNGLITKTLHSYEGRRGLKETAFEIYKDLFTSLKRSPEQKLLRLWNYIPKILDKDGSLERYHQFNEGRYEAWKKYGPKDSAGHPVYPAATGIGSHGGPVIVDSITTTHPVYHLQNPRQTPAHKYSKKYGPLPPVFSRATLHLPPSGPELYVAGTASIVGEDAVWLDDARMQTRETLKNISILIGKDNLSSFGCRAFDFKDLSGIRVYIKRPKDLSIIRKEIEQVIDPARIIYLHDDICRKEWLLEIEGVARRSGR